LTGAKHILLIEDDPAKWILPGLFNRTGSCWMCACRFFLSRHSCSLPNSLDAWRNPIKLVIQEIVNYQEEDMGENKAHPSYMSPKLEARNIPEKGGYGIFAREAVEQGHVLAVWGGIVVPGARFWEYSEFTRTHGLQVEEDLFLLPLTLDDPSDLFNHSCTPNAGLCGQITLVAMFPIAVDEEICFDYAMSDSNPYDEFDCQCGTPHCRGRIVADDWMRPELQERYKGYFSPYLQRRMDRLKK
jgi:uncharacterized protein